MRKLAILGGLALLTAAASASADSPHLKVAANAAELRAKPAQVFDAQVRARTFLPKNALDVRATSTDKFGDGDQIVHFEQVHNGLPVIGRGASVRLSKSGDAIVTATALQTQLPSSTVPAISAAVAASTVAPRVRIGNVDASHAHLVVWTLQSGEARLAYVVLPKIPFGLPTSPRFVVDAQTGDVIEARDLVRFMNNATVYEFNPVKTPNLTSFPLPIAPDGTNGGTLQNAFVSASNCIDKQHTASLNFGGFPLTVHICDLTQTAVADATTGDYVYPPTDVPLAGYASDSYSEVAMYYNATKAYEFYRTMQGDPEAQVTVDKPLRTISNLQLPAGLAEGDLSKISDPNTPLEPFQNAFFSPAGGSLGMIFQQIYGVTGGALWFGQGPRRDYSYDGDVIYHEFTHAVVDKTLQLEQWHVDSRGAIDSPGAMNEGLADFFSSSITGDPDVGEYASKDIDENTTVIRTLANMDKCPTTLIGEVHFDSTLFSGGLWTARTSFTDPADQTKFVTALYKAMRANPGKGDLGYDDLTNLFLATLTTDFPAGATALTKAMTDRGVLPSCERIIDYSGKPIAAPAKDLGGFAAPGTQSVTFGKTAPGIIQIHVNVSGIKSVTASMTVPKPSTSTNPLAGSATPASLVLLMKVGKPITWANATHDADEAIAETTAGTGMYPVINIPDGATDLYLQVGNNGQSDGVYDAITLATEPAASTTPVPTPDPGASNPASSSSGDSGCGCSTPGHTTTTGIGALAGLGMLAGVLRLRRRNSGERKE